MTTSWSGLPARLESKIIPEPNSGCWLWLGAHGKYGHGSVKIKGKNSTTTAHKTVYELLVGPVPDRLLLDHFWCNNPPCVNPEHVRPASYQENTIRSNKTIASNFLARDRCAQGHLFNEENTGFEGRSRARICLACRKAQQPYQAQWHKENRARSVGYSNKWRKANLDKHNAARRARAKRKREMLCQK